MAAVAPPKSAAATNEMNIEAIVRAALQRIKNQTVSATLVLRYCTGSPSLNAVLRELQRLAKIGTTLHEVGSRQGTRLFQRVKIDSMKTKQQKRGAELVPPPPAVASDASVSSPEPVTPKEARINAADVMGLGDLRDETEQQQLLTGDFATMDDDDFM